MVLGLVTVSDL